MRAWTVGAGTTWRISASVCSSQTRATDWPPQIGPGAVLYDLRRRRSRSQPGVWRRSPARPARRPAVSLRAFRLSCRTSTSRPSTRRRPAAIVNPHTPQRDSSTRWFRGRSDRGATQRRMPVASPAVNPVSRSGSGACFNTAVAPGPARRIGEHQPRDRPVSRAPPGREVPDPAATVAGRRRNWRTIGLAGVAAVLVVVAIGVVAASSALNAPDRPTDRAARPALHRRGGRRRCPPRLRRRVHVLRRRRGGRVRLRRRRHARPVLRRRVEAGCAVPEPERAGRRPALRVACRTRRRTSTSVTGAYPIDIDGDRLIDLVGPAPGRERDPARSRRLPLRAGERGAGARRR